MRSLINAVCAALAVLPTSATLTTTQSDSFSLAEGKDLFTFEYSTSSANDTNWIGIFNPGGGPGDGQLNEHSVTWDYAPEASGELFIDPSGLEPGSYDAYFLADDGYKSLADSITVEVPVEPVHFIPTTGITLRNAREGDDYEASVSGLIGDLGDTEVEFKINSAENGDWATISSDGLISGNPSAQDAGQTTKLTVQAATSDSSTELEVSIPVKAKDTPLVSELSVMSYNLWHEGTQVNNYHEKQVAFLSEANVDLVSFQESSSDRTSALADALGWEYFHGSDSTGIISRYPIAEEYPLDDRVNSVAVRVDLGDSEINVRDVHLGYTPYGPYDFCFDGMTKEEVLEREEESGRTPQIRDTMTLMESHLNNSESIPVLLFGDFNAPSQLDWTDDTADQHCGVGSFEWPTSKAPLDAGLVDALREVYPDPSTDPHITWSPIYKINDDYDGQDEPMDRIDFVYYKGSLTPVAADTLVRGTPKPEPDHENNEWTSDHKAVIVTFQL
ncbi:hypothetical protein FQN54_006792 [Arachnomyces sp. PD_36]|nr:hypothetical protein FQN54_006792 [Arachnomyces sp. PD_36]